MAIITAYNGVRWPVVENDERRKKWKTGPTHE
jgi:hypothetical protein